MYPSVPEDEVVRADTSVTSEKLPEDLTLQVSVEEEKKPADEKPTFEVYFCVLPCTSVSTGLFCCASVCQ